MRQIQVLGLIVFFVLNRVQSAQVIHPQLDVLCFKVPNVSNCISGRFRQYWEQNGGLPIFGYPMSPQRPERNRDTGEVYQVQWFERARFELHPGQNKPYDVLLGRLGDDQLLHRGVDWTKLPREGGPKRNCLWFPETGHNVCDQVRGAQFKTYWQTHGIRDKNIGSFKRSLALLGMPLTEPRMEVTANGERVLTQWFERTRLEYRPGKPQKLGVLIGSEVFSTASALSVDATILPATTLRQGTVARIEAIGFTPNEDIRFWLTAPDGTIVGTETTANIGPTTRNYILWNTDDPKWQIQPGNWYWTFEGTSSKHQAVAHIKITPR
jgi:hypothetical protein